MKLYQNLMQMFYHARGISAADLLRTREEQLALKKSLIERLSIENLPTFVSYLLLSGDPKLAAACSGNERLLKRLEAQYK
ncbi:hypothetical protein J4480_01400 [Candidatus Woesearchaeota archaeon]|nr:hypothetical protein [Candidatus Woesearchaeota archaeon]